MLNENDHNKVPLGKKKSCQNKKKLFSNFLCIYRKSAALQNSQKFSQNNYFSTSKTSVFLLTMFSKNSEKSTNTASRRSKRKETKKNTNKLITVLFKDKHFADNSATEQLSKHLQATSDLEAANKRACTFSEKDMEIDLSSPSTLTTPSQNNSQIVTSNSAAISSTAVQISTQVQTPILNNAQVNHFDSQLPNEETQQHQQNVAPENNSLSLLEQRILNDNNYQQQQYVQEPHPLKSRHDPNNMLDDNNDEYD